MKISFDEMKKTIKEALMNNGLSEEQAEIVATTHTESSLDGVYSHGLNRIPRFINYVNNGWINLDAELKLVKDLGVIRQYDGDFGIGIINAKKCTQIAMDLADKYGIGIVALRNTTHWMRGGTYILDALKKGYMAIAWTNTESCMPSWGSKEQNIGNNPLCIGVINGDKPLVLDMAMSQYSFGKLQVTRLANKKLPFVGGYNVNGEATTDPGEIEESGRIMPTGYWKGSGLAIALDLLASIISNGNSTAQVDKINKGSCTGSSQIFILIDPKKYAGKDEIQEILESTMNNIKNAQKAEGVDKITYPGENMLSRRKRALEEGIEADEKIWEKVLEFRG